MSTTKNAAKTTKTSKTAVAKFYAERARKIAATRAANRAAGSSIRQQIAARHPEGVIAMQLDLKRLAGL